MPAPSLSSQARQVASAALPQNKVIYGGDETDAGSHPWLGSMRSRTAESVPRNYVSGGSNFLYLPRDMSWRRRNGQTIKFDTFASPVGLLPAKWGAKARWADSYLDDTFADGIPSIACLLTKETLADPTNIDDGRFSNYWLRNQNDNTNYTLGSEFDAVTYPPPGDVQSLRFIPLWYDSGDGGITRGEDEFARRFFVSGGRRWLKVGNWTYFPSLLGTPSRWQRRMESGFESQGGGTLQADSDVNAGWGTARTGVGGSADGTTPAAASAFQNDDGNTLYIGINDSADVPVGTNPQTCGLNGTVTPGRRWTVNCTVRTFAPGPMAAGSTIQFRLVDSGGERFNSAQIDISGTTDTWAPFSVTIDGTTGGSVAGTANSIEVDGIAVPSPPSSGGMWLLVTFVSVVEEALAEEREVNRLIPSGPLPPTHAGSLVKGTPISSGSSVTIVPDTDIDDGGWLNQAGSATNLFASIDETTTDDTDYIAAAFNGAQCKVGLSDPGFAPTGATHTVTIFARARRTGVATNATVTVELYEGTTNISLGSPPAGTFGSTFANYTYTLTAAEVNSVTDWTNLALWIDTAGSTGGIQVSQANVSIVPSDEPTGGGWKGSDRFLYSVAYRFEDQSVWMPNLPRFPNDILPNGFNMFTVDSENTTLNYDKVQWTNIPIGPYGVIGRILLRTPKIDSTAADNLQIDPFDLRIVNEVKDNTSTTYDDYSADDDSLVLDQAEQFIRYDHIMPPRARYNFGGDMRVCHSYGGLNPCAIEIAPVGRSADYDLNHPDGTASIYNQDASYMRILKGEATDSLELAQTDGTSFTNNLVIDFATYNTLQKLVDRINATSFATDGQQWRAQICPGQNPEALCTNTLTPHRRTIQDLTITSGSPTITRAAGGLSDVPVGALISVSGVSAMLGFRVIEIVSDTELTLDNNATTTSSTADFTFRFDFGDAPTVATANSGYQRVIANSLPGFLFWNKAYLDQFPLDKSAIWMTVASPGASKSAANCFSARIDNKFIPPGNPGISMGGAGVDQGFVTPFGNAIYAIRNVRERGTGLDQDYRLEAINESRGCCAWNTVSPGNRFVPYLTPEGMCVADLFSEVLISSDIYVDAPLPGLGDFTYEIPLCVAATASDTDGAYASARIMRSMLWVNFRSSGSLPNRQTCYDFSSGSDSAGLPAIARSKNQAWGWSVPLVRAFTAMCLGTRADGFHLYGFNDANVGSTGDGRVDEFETSDTDNGTAIAGSIETPWEDLGRNTLISAQEITLIHVAPTGSTGSLIFHRSYLDQQFTMTPSTSSTLPVSRDIKMLTLPARTPTAACFISYTQATGGAREVREIELRLKSLPSYR